MFIFNLRVEEYKYGNYEFLIVTVLLKYTFIVAMGKKGFLLPQTQSFVCP